MPDVIAEVTTEVLQAFADAWNRHDIDALMSFMTEDCVFEPLQALRSAAPGMQVVRLCEPASRRYGQPSPMPTGVARGILSEATVECQSGPSREHAPTALASRSTVVICSHFETARSP